MNRENENIVDEHGTGQKAAQEMLKTLWTEGFNSDLEFLALALGRDARDLNALMNGDDFIDDDLVIIMREIARNRNIRIEDGTGIADSSDSENTKNGENYHGRQQFRNTENAEQQTRRPDGIG